MVSFALLTLMFFIPITSGTDLRVHRYVTRRNIKLQRIIEEPLTVRSKIECVLECSRNSSCRSVFWHSVKPRCRLSMKDVAHSVPVPWNKYPEYDALGEIVYPGTVLCIIELKQVPVPVRFLFGPGKLKFRRYFTIFCVI